MKIRRSWMAVLFLTACAALVATATPGAAQTVPDWWLGPDSEYVDMVKKAQAEGTVVWRADPDPTKELDGLFEKEYGIKVDHEEIRSATLLTQVLQEKAAKRKTIDVGGFGLEHIQVLVQHDLVEQLDWSKNKAVRDSPAPNKLVVGDNLGIAAVTYFRDAIYNKDLVAEKDVPVTYEDLLDPKWGDGKIGIDTDLRSFLIIAQPHIWGVEKTEDYIRKLGKQKPKMHPNAGVVAEWVASGEVLVGLNEHQTWAYQYPNVEWKALKPAVPVVVTPYVALKSAEHPYAAKLFMHWILNARGVWEAFLKPRPRVGVWVPIDQDLVKTYAPKTDQPFEMMAYEWSVEIAKTGLVKRLQKALGAR